VEEKQRRVNLSILQDSADCFVRCNMTSSIEIRKRIASSFVALQQFEWKQ
jgi:hypothetical protein